MSLETQIREHIVGGYLDGEAEGLTDQTSLINLNVFDSAALYDVLEFLRRRFNVTIPVEEATPKNFDSIEAMATLVRRAQAR